MLLKSICFTATLLSYLGLSGVQAQETITTNGGNVTGTGGSVSYSIGQIVYTTSTGTNGSVAQGVQQPYEISVVSGIEDAKDITLICTVYPNPTFGLLKLKLENYDIIGLSYQLYDMNGRLITSQKVEKPETDISMENLGASTYFLRITETNKVVKTFKIIKN